MNHGPLLKRMSPDGVPSMTLGDEQIERVGQFLSKLEAGVYVEHEHPCLCKQRKDRLVAMKDRYGIPLRTVLCRHCGLMRSDPFYTDESLATFYSHDYRPIYTPGDENVSKELIRGLGNGERIISFLAEHQVSVPERIVEIGCGYGGNLFPFVQRGHRVSGCDLGHEGVQIGRRFGLDLRGGGYETIEIDDGPCLVILSHVLEHYRDPVALLTALRERLTPSSIIYIEVPGIFNIRQVYRDPALYLQNAHAYHYCLATLDYVARLSGIDPVAGTEAVRAVYRSADKCVEVKPDELLAKRIERHISRIDRIRAIPYPCPGLRTSVQIGRVLLGRRAYRRLRRMMGRAA